MANFLLCARTLIVARLASVLLMFYFAVGPSAYASEDLLVWVENTGSVPIYAAVQSGDPSGENVKISGWRRFDPHVKSRALIYGYSADTYNIALGTMDNKGIMVPYNVSGLPSKGYLRPSNATLIVDVSGDFTRIGSWDSLKVSREANEVLWAFQVRASGISWEEADLILKVSPH
ncbi:MAG: hypothetical protein AAGI89_06745 [Pseudomonadota bacterium]